MEEGAVCRGGGRGVEGGGGGVGGAEGAGGGAAVWGCEESTDPLDNTVRLLLRAKVKLNS